MTVPAGRSSKLYAWNSYEWSFRNPYQYVAAGWTVDSSTTVASKEATVVITPPAQYPRPSAYMGVMFGLRQGQGYDRQSRWVPAAAAGQVKLIDLQARTNYYLVPVMKNADGSAVCGPEQILSTL